MGFDMPERWFSESSIIAQSMFLKKQLKSIIGQAITIQNMLLEFDNCQPTTATTTKTYCDPLVSDIMLTKAYHIFET